MTLASEISRIAYFGNGSKTTFPVPFRFLADEHLAVYILNTVSNVETVQVLTTNYTVSGANEPAGGTITLTTAPTANQILTIIRDTPYDQLLDFKENEAFSAAQNEFAYDKLTMLLQQATEHIRRGVLLKATTPLDADLDSLYPAKGGFNSIFPARLTSAVGDGSYNFTERAPTSGGSLVTRTNGIVDVAWPLDHCLDDWTSDLPINVMIHVHTDENGDLTYIFQPPPPCSVEV